MFDIYKKLLKYVPKEKKLVYIAIFFSCVAAFLTVSAYFYLNKFFQMLIIEKKVSISFYYVFLISGLLFLGQILYMISGLISHKLGFRLETNLRKKGIDGITNASFQFFDTHSSGRTRKIIDDNASETHQIIAHLIPDNAEALLMPILILILSFFISLRVGIAFLILFAITSFTVKFMMGEVTFMEIYQKSLEKLSNETVEYVRGMPVVKIFGANVSSFQTLHKAIYDYANYAHAYSKSCKRPFVLFQLFFFGFPCFAIPFAVLLWNRTVNTSILSVELIMILFLSGVLFTSIMKIMYVSMYAYKAKAAVDKLEQLFFEMQENKLQFGKEEKFENFNITFDKVSFAYHDKMVLKNLSFTLPEKRTYAFVGASGSGKSTIAKLISGFYNIQEGSIYIGGKLIESYSENAIIQNISFVFQNAKLFKTSIYENIKLAREEASREEIMNALHLAGCDSILEKFKERENTIIGSKGVYLSGGEKQRIAIARAMLKNSPIIILDEASAAVDPENEHELQVAFSNLMKGKTVLMIAHRLSTIRNVDEILVLEKGNIIERGSHEELIKKESIYKKFQTLYGQANEWRVSYENIS